LLLWEKDLQYSCTFLSPWRVWLLILYTVFHNKEQISQWHRLDENHKLPLKKGAVQHWSNLKAVIAYILLKSTFWPERVIYLSNNFSVFLSTTNHTRNIMQPKVVNLGSYLEGEFLCWDVYWIKKIIKAGLVLKEPHFSFLYPEWIWSQKMWSNKPLLIKK
jgi:hypothetical protein